MGIRPSLSKVTFLYFLDTQFLYEDHLILLYFGSCRMGDEAHGCFFEPYTQCLEAAEDVCLALFFLAHCNFALVCRHLFVEF